MSNPDADDLREVVRECWAAAQNCCASKGEDSAPSCCDASPERACCSESADPAQETELREGAQGTSGLDPDGIRQLVRERYAGASTGGSPCCADRAEPSCCAANADVCCPEQGSSSVEATSARLGYSPEELAAVPEGANMGLGCGNPQAIAALKPGETLLDLGSGGGFDCFLAARQVGETGRVIGVDMTPEMITKARQNAARSAYGNVEFRLGEIEHLPVADNTVDVLISNCVINLSPDKPAVYRDAFRVLRPGGRIAISDVVRTTEAELPEEIRADLALLGGCVAGAASVGEVETMLREAGFDDIRVDVKEESREFIREWAPGRNVEQYVASATIEAAKPRA